jgi:predicted lipid-binding transport protein (Tim44 family)
MPKLRDAVGEQLQAGIMPVETGIAMMITVTGNKTPIAGGLKGRRVLISAMMMMIVVVAMLLRMRMLGRVIMEIRPDLARENAEGEREHARYSNQTSSNVVRKQRDVSNAQTHCAGTPSSTEH